MLSPLRHPCFPVWFSGRLVSEDDIVPAISIVKPANVPFSKHFISVYVKIKLIYFQSDSL